MHGFAVSEMDEISPLLSQETIYLQGEAVRPARTLPNLASQQNKLLFGLYFWLLPSAKVAVLEPQALF